MADRTCNSCKWWEPDKDPYGACDLAQHVDPNWPRGRFIFMVPMYVAMEGGNYDCGDPVLVTRADFGCNQHEYRDELAELYADPNVLAVVFPKTKEEMEAEIRDAE